MLKHHFKIIFARINQKTMKLKKYILFTCCLLASLNLYPQSHTLTLTNGYGGGVYDQGDTVDVWSSEYSNTQTFSEWTGDIQFLAKPYEWHTTLVMPGQNISLAAVIKTMPVYTLSYEQIKGKNNLKNVYYCFPSQAKGIIYFFHGTGGSASGWVEKPEARSMVNAAIADTFGIIITEAEEITLNSDLNSDGKLRWLTFPLDTVNGIDYLNIKILTDTFVNRGYISAAIPKFSIGMSNGGAFSAAISYAYHYKAGISYCASSVQQIYTARNNSFAFRMAKYDDNAEVGPAGNYQAWQNDSILESRSICHDYQLHDRQPIYAQRFARIQGISLATSQSIFNELSLNNQIDANGYAIQADTILSHYQSNPSAYPTLSTLTTDQKLDVLSQISASNAEHNFYSDLNHETLTFLDNLCSTVTGYPDPEQTGDKINVYPNPADNSIVVNISEGNYGISIFNQFGQRVKYLNDINGRYSINVSELSAGIYFITAFTPKNILTTKFIKQ
jgi:hypothetical protein